MCPSLIQVALVSRFGFGIHEVYLDFDKWPANTLVSNSDSNCGINKTIKLHFSHAYEKIVRDMNVTVVFQHSSLTRWACENRNDKLG